MAPNKQVLQLVAYIAGGPDVSQEAPRRLATLFRRVSLPLMKLWDRGKEWREAAGSPTGRLQTTLWINNYNNKAK